MGVISPVRQAYLHAVTARENRATVVSFDAMVSSIGGVGGQVGLGAIADARSLQRRLRGRRSYHGAVASRVVVTAEARRSGGYSCALEFRCGRGHQLSSRSPASDGSRGGFRPRRYREVFVRPCHAIEIQDRAEFSSISRVLRKCFQVRHSNHEAVRVLDSAAPTVA